MFKPMAFLHLENLVVAESFRRQGIASELMAAVRLWAVDRGLHSIRLKVYSANTEAVCFYERAGFAPLSLTMEARLPAERPAS